MGEEGKGGEEGKEKERGEKGNDVRGQGNEEGRRREVRGKETGEGRNACRNGEARIHWRRVGHH